MRLFSTKAGASARVVLVAVLAAGLTISALKAEALRVGPGAIGAGTGATWTDAFTDLQSALAVAQSGDEIWIKAGVHKPTAGTSRSATFTIPSGVSLLGGFVGNENYAHERNFLIQLTTLSGDIGVSGNAEDNVYHVVRGGANSVLDGVHVTAGNADSTGSDGLGAGLFNNSIVSMKVRNCVFFNNSAVTGGGAVNNASTPATFENCVFTSNAGTNATSSLGGAVYVSGGAAVTFKRCQFFANRAANGGAVFAGASGGATITLNRCTFNANAASATSGGALYAAGTQNVVVLNGLFNANTSANRGGAIYLDSGVTMSLVNCTLFNNSATTTGGAIYNTGAALSLVNCISRGNSDAAAAPVLLTGGATSQVSKSNLQGSGGSGAWSGNAGTDNGGNLDSDPLFANSGNPAGSDNIFGTGDDGLILAAGSPSADSGNANTANPIDIIGRMRPAGNGFDMGAYEGVQGTDTSFSFFSAGATVAETAGTLTIPVQFSAPTTTALTLEYSVTGGTAISGLDYTSVAGTLSIASGATGTNIVVPILDDAIPEPYMETFTVQLSTPTAGILGAFVETTVTILDDDTSGTPMVFMPSAGRSGLETDTSASVSLLLSRPVGQSVAVSYTITGTASVSLDYTTAAGMVVFRAGEVKKDLPLTVINDKDLESNETMIVTLSTGVGVTATSSTYTYTIVDNDALPSVFFESERQDVNEGSSTSIQVSLTAPSDQQVSLLYFLSGGTATTGVDYSTVGGTLTFTTGATAAFISFFTISDTTPEADETVALTIANPPQNAALSTGATTTITIKDDDVSTAGAAVSSSVPTIAFNTSAASVQENGFSSSVSVLLSNTSSETVSVAYAVTGGSATSGSDYTLSSGTLSFSPGSTSRSFSVSILDDIVAETDETVAITLTAATNATLSSPAVYTLTILDNDTVARTVGFSSTAVSVNERSSTSTGISLSQPANQIITVDYAVSGGTALNGVDYTTLGGTIGFTTGASFSSISIIPINDLLVEGDETIVITLSNPVGASLGTNTSITATIVDNEVTPTVRFSSSGFSVSERQSGSSTLFLSLTPVIDSPVVVDFSISGTASTNSDYTISSGNAVFSAGSSSASVSLAIINDALTEANETIVLTLTTPANATLGTVPSSTVTILDNDGGTTVGFSSSAITAAENSSTSAFVVLSTAVDSPVFVNYAFSSGTATAGTDYTTPGGTLQIPAGSTSAAIPLGLINDQNEEGAESFTITLSSPVGGTLGTIASTTVTVSDNDAAPTVSFSAAAASRAENLFASISASLSNSSDIPIVVTYTVSGGTATLFGVDSRLYPKGVLSFSPGSTSSTLSLSIVNDTAQESDETLVIDLSAPVNAALGAITRYTHTIIDNDAPPSAQFALSVDTATEAETTRSVFVQLSAASDSAITLSYSATGGTATGGGADYSLSAGSLTFSAGSTTSAISLFLKEDSFAEGDETVVITLSNPSGATLGTRTTYTLTIRDNDTIPLLRFSRPIQYVLESNSGSAIPLELSAPYGLAASGNFAVVGGTATQSVDYTLLSGNVNFSALATASSISGIGTISDNAIEDNETLTLRLSNPVNAVLGAGSEATITIVDDDGPLITQRETTALYAEHKAFGGGSYESASGLVLDALNGGLYVAGIYQGNADFDPGPGISILTASTSSGLYVSRFDSKGAWQWTKVMENNSSADLTTLRRDTTGNLYLCGSFSGTLDLDPGAALLNTTAAGSNDIFFIKINANGDLVWGRSMGGSGYDSAEDLRVGADGTVYLGGVFNGTMDFDAGAGTDSKPSEGSSDGFIAKYDANGNYVWGIDLGGAGQDEVNSLALDSSGFLYVLGDFSDTVNFAPPPTVDLRTSAGALDVFLLKLDSQKNPQGLTIFGSKSNDEPKALDVAPNGEILLCFEFSGELDVDPGTAADLRRPASANGDSIIVKLSASRSLVWAQAFQGSAEIHVHDLLVGDQGLVYLGGHFNGAGDFDPGPGFDIRRSTASDDAWIARLGADGSLQWMKNFGGSGYDQVDAIAVNGGEFFACGSFYDTVDFDPGAGVALTTSTGSVATYGAADAFLVRYTQTLPALPVAAVPLSMIRAPFVSAGARSRVWVGGGKRPFTLSVTPENAARVAGSAIEGLVPGPISVKVRDAAGQELVAAGEVGPVVQRSLSFPMPAYNGPGDFIMVGIPIALVPASHSSLRAYLEERLGPMSPDNFMLFGYTGVAGDGYEDLTSDRVTVGPGRGYWIASLGARDLSVAGPGLSDRDIAEIFLPKGWNLISNPFPTALAATNVYVALAAADLPVKSTEQTVTAKNFWHFSRSAGQYASLSQLAPGQAAWLFVSDSAGATVFAAQGASETRITKADGEDRKADGEGRLLSEMTLDAGEPLPPAPPAITGSGTAPSGSGGGCFVGE